MQVIKVAPRGYCKGVIHAINVAKQTAKQYPDRPIYVLGMLVHNQYVMKALQALNIKSIDDHKKTRLELLDDIAEGVVIFTAHGISDAVIEKAQKKGLICVNASCSDVIQTQNIVKDYVKLGYEVLYIGKQHHPEAEAVCAISSHVHLITAPQDIPEAVERPVFVTNQTTMSIFDIEALFQRIKEQYPDTVISEEICNATRIRQEAIAALKGQDIDLLYVVGDRHSNNSSKLAKIAAQQGIPNVYLIDDVTGIQDEHLKGISKVAVTSGASTPTYLTSQVISYLEQYRPQAVKPDIELSNIL